MLIISPKTPRHSKTVLRAVGILAERDARNPFVLKNLGRRAGRQIFSGRDRSVGSFARTRG